MDAVEFAADRSARLTAGEAALEHDVDLALEKLAQGDADWDAELVVAASALWIDTFRSEAPENGRRGLALARYRRDLKAALEKTAVPDTDVSAAQTERVTRWLATYTVNSATHAAIFASGTRFSRWVTMRDADVRDIHDQVDGQVARVGGTFNVGGQRLQYPGEPIGPPAVWINCRCVIQPAAQAGEAMTPTTYTLGPDDVLDIDNPDIITSDDVYATKDPSGGRGIVPPYITERLPSATDPDDIAVEPVDEADLIDDDPEDDEELITEVPVHGVLAPEGVATGDRRMFAIGALSTRQLPIPLRVEIMSTHGGLTSDVVTIGRVDEAWRDDASDTWRYRGAIVLDKPHAQETIAGIIDGTIRGVSIDGDDYIEDNTEKDRLFGELQSESQGSDRYNELLAELEEMPTLYTRMRAAGLTIVPIPAFEEAYVGLGHDFLEDLSTEDQAALAACGCLGETASAEPNVWLREIDTATRKKMADAGTAMPDGSYPIANCDDLRNAIQAIGRAKDPEATKRHIRKRKSALGCDEVELPEDWAAAAEAYLDNDFVATPQGAPTATPEQAVAYGYDAVHPRSAAGSVLVESAAGTELLDLDGGGELGRLRPDAVPGPAVVHASSGVVPLDGRGAGGGAGSPVPAAALPEPGSPDALHAAGEPAAFAGDAGAAERRQGALPAQPRAGRQAHHRAAVLPDLSARVRAHAPGTHDGPGWITHPVPTARIRRYWETGAGAAKIRWGIAGDFDRCRKQLAKYVSNPEWLAGLCANMHYEVLGTWPGAGNGRQHGVQGQRAPVLTAGGAKTYPSAWFENPGLDHAAPMRIEGQRIFGYLAQWGVCHIGVEGMCREVPRSRSQYGYFLKGVVDTDRGEQRVGTLTYGIGHASRFDRAAAATAHYDQTDAVRAFVNIGEDEHGIWFAGVLAPWVTEDDVFAMRAIGALSGDWRNWSGLPDDLELVGAVAVDVPGYQLAASGAMGLGYLPVVEEAEAIVASATVKVELDADMVGAIVRTAVADYRHQERVAAKVGPVRERIRTARLARVRDRVNREG